MVSMISMCSYLSNLMRILMNFIGLMWWVEPCLCLKNRLKVSGDGLQNFRLTAKSVTSCNTPAQILSYRMEYLNILINHCTYFDIAHQYLVMTWIILNEIHVTRRNNRLSPCDHNLEANKVYWEETCHGHREFRTNISPSQDCELWILNGFGLRICFYDKD